MKRSLVVFLSLVIATTSIADTVIVQTTNKLPLVEVYTSEGCSSCPPADRWLSELVSHPDLFKKFVPIAFHVSYWDYIGHKDRFADERSNKRQRAHASRVNAKNVYTPELFVAGNESRGWRGKEFTIKSLEKGSLLKIIKKDNGEYEAISDAEDVKVHIAQLTFSEQTKPKRGENAGVLLKHDFVIKQWSQKSLITKPADKSAIVAWIENKQGQPIQAVGAWIKKK